MYLSKHFESALIGSSESRQALTNEIDEAYQQSLEIDQRKGKEAEDESELLLLQQQRAQRVRPEPSEGNTISFRHPNLGTFRRMFSHESFFFRSV